MTWQRTMTEALLRGTDRKLYETNASFYHAINQFVAMIPSFVDGLAASAEIQEQNIRRGAYNIMHGIVEPTPVKLDDYVLGPSMPVRKKKERKCECDEPSFGNAAKPVEAWWRCHRCHGLLWMGSAPENMEEAPFRWPNLNEWLDDHPHEDEVPFELRPVEFTSGWLPMTKKMFFCDTNGRVRRGEGRG